MGSQMAGLTQGSKPSDLRHMPTVVELPILMTPQVDFGATRFAPRAPPLDDGPAKSRPLFAEQNGREVFVANVGRDEDKREFQSLSFHSRSLLKPLYKERSQRCRQRLKGQ